MKVEYNPTAPKGRTCRECKNFQINAGSPAKGRCFGHEVIAEGGCNMFEAK